MRFEVDGKSGGGARRGRLHTAHGVVETPAFMPVATHGAVKGVPPWILEEIGVTMVLSNAYHLAQRPGVDVVQALGGVHGLLSWPGPVLTDSGGFQLFSLAALLRVDDDGVEYRSHVDGQRGRFTPEDAIAVQEAMGVDIAMCLDECLPVAASAARVEEALRRTTAWAGRCMAARRRPDTAVFAIVQGGFDAALRARSAAELVALGFDGHAVGGLCVGEPPEQTRETAAALVPHLPADRPRYLMGVGTPRDLLTFVSMGYDLFDCVLPTRNARNGMLFTREGKLTIRNARHAGDTRPVDEACGCPTCRRFSRGALRHLMMTKEMLGAHLATVHNLYFYLQLMREIRAALEEGTFPERPRRAAGAWA